MIETTETKFLPNGTAQRGREIYETQLRDKLEPEHFGKYLVIDIETGQYEIDEDHLTAVHRLIANKSDGKRFGMRIGYRTIGRFGGRRFEPR